MALRAIRISILMLLAGTASTAFAQSLGADPLSVTVSPQYPQPYDTITITPGSTLFDLGASTITISVNGKQIQKGSGGQGAPYKLGPAGEIDTIVVTATSPQGTFQKTVVVRPASVALVMEPVSTTHPFYAGASLLASEGRLRLIALPEFKTSAGAVPASSLVYTWKVGDRILADQSGIGHSTLIATAPIRYRDTTVSVAVATPDNSVVGFSSVILSPVDPILLIYRNDVLAGPEFDTALGSTFSMSGSEESFRATPYYFSGTGSLAWNVNGEPSGSDAVITVRTTGQAAGTALLSATATHAGSYLSASASTNIHFGESTQSSNIFGL